MEPTAEGLPASLTLDEAYRAAFYMVLQYLNLESDQSDFVLFVQYLWTDPARWADWLSAVSTALADGGQANPDHQGLWQVRPDIPDLNP
jgi:hypothetical protein